MRLMAWWRREHRVRAEPHVPVGDDAEEPAVRVDDGRPETRYSPHIVEFGE